MQTLYLFNFYYMSPDSVSSISTANSSAKTSSSKKMFRRGDIRVNGVRLNIAQTLRGVARNINNSLAKIGLLRAEIVSSPKGEKLLIISSKKTLNIRDPQGILSDLFKSKKVGTSDDSMVQITGKGKIGKRIKVIYSNAPEEVVSSLSIFSAFTTPSNVPTELSNTIPISFLLDMVLPLNVPFELL